MSNYGSQSVKFTSPVSIISTASIVGPKEGEGPLSKYFDIIMDDILAGKESWEKAESEMVNKGLDLAVRKSGVSISNIDYILAGDLLNQSIGSTFGIRDLGRPHIGIFGACSTIGLGLSIGSMFIDGGFATNVLVGASSHFCAAEKQFRFPLELGTQRPPTSTWTVTGNGSAVLSKNGKGPFVTSTTNGKIVDMGIKDANNMGAAMAPAAVDTLCSHFKDLEITPDYYDLILTGDLGYIGHELVINLMEKEGYDLSKNYTDCGILIFDKETQDTHSGGSGCACSAVTFAGYIYDKLKKGELNKVLFIPTGALLSTTSIQQGESIPGIAHAVSIESGR